MEAYGYLKEVMERNKAHREALERWLALAEVEMDVCPECGRPNGTSTK